MNALLKSTKSPEPMTRDKWCVEFVNELVVNASPPVPMKVARAIAQTV